MVLKRLPSGGLIEVPPDHCGHPGCTETLLRPDWGECPLPTCRAMCRVYDCPQGHVTVADWHEHRIVPTERPRWRCAYEL